MAIKLLKLFRGRRVAWIALLAVIGLAIAAIAFWLDRRQADQAVEDEIARLNEIDGPIRVDRREDGLIFYSVEKDRVNVRGPGLVGPETTHRFELWDAGKRKTPPAAKP